MKNKNKLRKAVLLLATCFVMPIATMAQDGSLDLSFGTGGIVTTDIGVVNAEGSSVAIQTDGKIVVAGTSVVGTNNKIALVRYKINGSLDSSFGGDGTVTTDIGTAYSVANAVALQADGKIVVAGYRSHPFGIILVRYHTDGSLDSSFGTAGIVNTGFGSVNAGANAIAIQSDGKIIAAGNTFNGSKYDFALARYNTNGSLDSSFGTAGKVITALGSESNAIGTIFLQPDGKIVAAGYKSIITTVGGTTGTKMGYALVRYNTDGSLDNTFGTFGVVTTSLSASEADWGKAAALQADGKIVMAGNSYFYPSKNFFSLVRYKTNGIIDSTFGTFGEVKTPMDSFGAWVYKVAIQADNKILVVAANVGFNMLRYKTDGSLDSTFGTAGKVLTNIRPIYDVPLGVAIQTDGRIVLAGYSSKVDTPAAVYRSFAVVRYNNPSLSISPFTNKKMEIVIYPNPTQDILHIEGAALGSTISLYDLQGKLINSEELQSSTPQIDMRLLTKGNYLLRIISPVGEVGSAKVLKE